MERGGSLEETKEFFSQWAEIGSSILKAIDWINHLPENISKYSIDLLAHVYQFLSGTILLTPTYLFSNPYSVAATLKFAGVGIIIVIILTMIEGIKRMFQKQNTDLNKTMKRFFLAVVATGFTPFLFTYSFQVLNLITKAVSKIGGSEISNFGLFGEIPFIGLGLGFIDTCLLILFDILVIALLKPIVLQTGRRWWNLLCLFCLTPLSLICWVFDDYKHYTNKWWSSLKQLAQSQLVYAIYICIMGIFIFGSRFVTSGGSLFVELLVVLGGLSAMANPPTFVRSKVDNGEDTLSWIKDIYQSGKNVWDTVTLKPTRSFINKKNEAQAKNVAQLRKKHGQRHVKGLT